MEIQERKAMTKGLERIYSVLDSGSFVEIGREQISTGSSIYKPDSVVESDGVITGFGTVNGRPCFVFCQDDDVMGGSFSEVQARKIINLYSLAIKAKAPILSLLSASGMRIEEGADGLNALGKVLKAAEDAGTKVLQIAVVFGRLAGGLSILKGMADYWFDESEVENARALITCLPHTPDMLPEQDDCTDDLNRLISKTEYGYVEQIADAGSVISIGKNIKAEIIKLNGVPVGCITFADTTVPQIEEAASIIRVFSKFNLGILTVMENAHFNASEMADEDFPLAAAQLIHEFATTSSPMVNLITGNLAGSIFSLISSKAAGADMVFMHDDATVTMLNPRQAAQIIAPNATPAETARLAEEYIEERCTASVLSRGGYCDKIVPVAETRKYVVGAFEIFANAF